MWIWSVVFASPSLMAQGPVVFDTFLLNSGAQKADIRPVYLLLSAVVKNPSMFPIRPLFYSIFGDF
jgi:hypothetical protein